MESLCEDSLRLSADRTIGLEGGADLRETQKLGGWALWPGIRVSGWFRLLVLRAHAHRTACAMTRPGSGSGPLSPDRRNLDERLQWWAATAVREALEKLAHCAWWLQEGDEAARRTAERYLVDASELRWTPDPPPGSDHLVASAPPTPTT